MKQIFIPFMILLVLASCGPNTRQTETNDSLIGANHLQLSSDIMTPEVLWAFGRLNDVQVSPDKTKLLYGVTYYSVNQNKGNRELFMMNIDGTEKTQITHTPFSEYNAIWDPDGKHIIYLSSESGSMQAWKSDLTGAIKTQLSHVDGDITNLALSPDGTKVFFTMDVKVDKNTADVYPDLPKSDGKIITDLMYRHWDSWEDGSYSHIFIAGFDGNSITNPYDIMPGEPYDTPLQPFEGIENISWTPDGTKIAYTCKKLKGKAYTLSTNSDIYLYDLATKETKNLTEGMPGYDRNPVFSPDGKKMYWSSMEHAGYEADKERIFELNFETGEKRYLTEKFDYSPSNLIWADNGNTLYFIAGVNARFQIYKMDVNTLEITAITKGDQDYHSITLAGNTLIGTYVSMVKPEEIYKVNTENGEATELSFENKEILDQLTMPTVKSRWVTTTDNKQMLVWVIYPPHFDENKKYPTLLYCEGGPQSPLSQFWSYRWNFSMMASNNYIIVAPCRRGVTTMGQKWTDEIAKDEDGQAMRDLLTAIDVVKKEPYVDADHLGAVGASFGAYSVNWLAGHHQKRFKAFISHCGVYNSEMEYVTTDEMFFDNWENGGAPWDTDNKVAMKSFKGSPHLYVKNWDTPIMVIEGENDFRIPYTQGMATFNTAQLLGIPSKFLIFPSESHWVVHPQNGILWQREFFGWLDQWLKTE